MPMALFGSLFPELGVKETRGVRITDTPGLPDGEYFFFEFYCNEPGCGCRRVILQVTKPPSKTILATISFGLESVAFYRARVGNLMAPEEMKGPSLDPFNPQSQYAPALLELVREELDTPEYLEVLERHCDMFESHVGSAAKRFRLRPSAGRRRRK